MNGAESCGSPVALDDTRAGVVRDASASRLLLVRHGEVVEEARGTLYGQRDVALSERGIEQSRLVAERLVVVQIDAVYSSDLSRASFLAGLLCAARGLEPTILAELRERHFGDWQYLPWKKVEASDPERFEAYWADRFRYRAPGGAENFGDVRARVIPLIEEIARRHSGETIAIAAHSGPLRIILAEALGLPLENIFRFEMGYCSMAVVDWAEDGARVQAMNSYDYVASATGGTLAGRLR